MVPSADDAAWLVKVNLLVLVLVLCNITGLTVEALSTPDNKRWHPLVLAAWGETNAAVVKAHLPNKKVLEGDGEAR